MSNTATIEKDLRVNLESSNGQYDLSVTKYTQEYAPQWFNEDYAAFLDLKTIIINEMADEALKLKKQVLDLDEQMEFITGYIKKDEDWIEFKEMLIDNYGNNGIDLLEDPGISIQINSIFRAERDNFQKNTKLTLDKIVKKFI